ncbi:MAG: CsgG/HfaB family protein, partial [Spirochaetia bacterium]
MTVKSKSIAVALFLFLCAAAVFSLPHVAVLNAILAPGIDPTVTVPVTDKIVEELVNSGKFVVIDRANVGQILQEKEFQLSSGIVRNEEIRQAGEYLGADFVIVANASRVGSTYVISAK